MDRDIQERWTRLQAFFESEPWEDLKAEISRCLDNADMNLKSQDCSDRSYFAGKCSGIQEILGLKNKCRVKASL